MSLKTEVEEVLVLETDALRAADIARTISRIFPSARVYCETAPVEAAALLDQRHIELFVVSVRGFDLDVLTLLGAWADHGTTKTRVLVMTPDFDSSAVKALRSLPIAGYFDSSSADVCELEVACRLVASGAEYRRAPSATEEKVKRPPNPYAPDPTELLWRFPPPKKYRFHRRIRRRDD